MASIDIRDISVGYENEMVLENISLNVKDGESLAIVGPSSCGKTTLMRAICGFNKITQGEIYVGDKLVSSAKKRISIAPEKRNIGVVFQDYAVWPHMTVLENVAYPLKKKNLSKVEAKERALKAIEQVKMKEYADRLPAQLSGGQQQRVALARALVSSEDLIILDEPITNLDATLREEMSYEIQQIQRELGVTIIYITHDLETAMTIADRMAIMNNKGNIEQLGTPEEIWTNPINQYVYKFLGVSNFIPVIHEKNTVRIEEFNISTAIENHILEEEKKYMMASRPIDIELNLADKNDQGFVAKMNRVTYLGDQFDYFLELGSYEIRVHQDSYMAFQKGVPEEGKYYELSFKHPRFYAMGKEDIKLERQVN